MLDGNEVNSRGVMDITPLLKGAMSSEINWMFSMFSDVIDRLNGNRYQVSYWDGEEIWASVLCGKDLIGFIWSKYPVFAVEREYVLDVQDLLEEFSDLNYIVVGSLAKDLLSMDDEVFRKHLDGLTDYSSFTMDDLWFATNAI